MVETCDSEKNGNPRGKSGSVYYLGHVLVIGDMANTCWVSF